MHISNIFLQDFCKILFKYYFLQGSCRESYHRYIHSCKTVHDLDYSCKILARTFYHTARMFKILQDPAQSCRIVLPGHCPIFTGCLCTMLALIQLIIKPYVSNILNIFDGFVLQIMILVSIVPLIDSYDQNLLLSVAFILLVLPLIAFAVMELFIHKNGIKKISRHIHHKPNSATGHRNYLLMDNLAPTSVKKLNR